MKSAILAGFLLLGVFSLAKGEETDPKAILQKSAEASSQLKSFKADMVIESFASLTPQTGTIYQKKDTNGMMLMRMDMNLPTNTIPQGAANIPSLGKTYTLITPQGVYTVMQDKAMKMDGMPGMDQLKNAMSSPDALKKISQEAQLNSVTLNMTNGVSDGKECWVISIPTSSAALEQVKKMMSSGPQKDLMEAVKMKMSSIPLPAQTVLFFDKQSNLMVKQESLDSNNKVLQSMTYLNIQPNIEISDQIFKLPDNIKIEDMSTMMQGLLKNIKNTK